MIGGKEANKAGETSPACGETPLGDVFGESVKPLMQQIGRTFTVLKRAYEADLGISPLAAWILTLLCQRDGLTQNELTGIVRVDPSMITRTVKEMEGEQGWIDRQRDPADNRLMRVYLTDQGRQRAHGLAERIAVVERRLTRDLSERQVEELRAMLRTLEETARGETDA